MVRYNGGPAFRPREVIRYDPDSGTMAIAFFPPLTSLESCANAIGSTSFAGSLGVLRTNDSALLASSWPPLAWTPLVLAEWPLPEFVSRDPLRKRTRLRRYRDEDICLYASERFVEESEAKGLPPDGVLGIPAVVKYVAALL